MDRFSMTSAPPPGFGGNVPGRDTATQGLGGYGTSAGRISATSAPWAAATQGLAGVRPGIGGHAPSGATATQSLRGGWTSSATSAPCVGQSSLQLSPGNPPLPPGTETTAFLCTIVCKLMGSLQAVQAKVECLEQAAALATSQAPLQAGQEGPSSDQLRVEWMAQRLRELDTGGSRETVGLEGATPLGSSTDGTTCSASRGCTLDDATGSDMDTRSAPTGSDADTGTAWSITTRSRGRPAGPWPRARAVGGSTVGSTRARKRKRPRRQRRRRRPPAPPHFDGLRKLWIYRGQGFTHKPNIRLSCAENHHKDRLRRRKSKRGTAVDRDETDPVESRREGNHGGGAAAAPPVTPPGGGHRSAPSGPHGTAGPVARRPSHARACLHDRVRRQLRSLGRAARACQRQPLGGVSPSFDGPFCHYADMEVRPLYSAEMAQFELEAGGYHLGDMPSIMRVFPAHGRAWADRVRRADELTSAAATRWWGCLRGDEATDFRDRIFKDLGDFLVDNFIIKPRLSTLFFHAPALTWMRRVAWRARRVLAAWSFLGDAVGGRPAPAPPADRGVVRQCTCGGGAPGNVPDGGASTC